MSKNKNKRVVNKKSQKNFKVTKKVVNKKSKRRFSMFKKVFLLLFFVFILIGGLFFYMYLNDNDCFDSSNDKMEDNNKTKDEIFSISSNISKVYLALNGTKQLNISFEFIGEPDRTLTWISDNESVVSVSNGVVTGIGVGSAKVTASTLNDRVYTFDVIVTDLITVPTLNNNKPYLPCGRYSREEAALLDEILNARIEEAGYGTRGAAVAVARFILLEFPYTIKYFNENGRMAHGHPFIDGEGRYYHKGLYLDSSKFADIVASTPSGPAIWGCNLYDSFLSSYRPNGFTCSGFVTWILYNAGLDVGDVGAGDYPNVQGELSDMGPHQQITYDFMKNGNYKVGDFIARDGHAALIIGISNDTIYTAESLPPKAKVYIYERYSGIVKDPNLTYIINMDTIYPNGEGIYTDMW